MGLGGIENLIILNVNKEIKEKKKKNINKRIRS